MRKLAVNGMTAKRLECYMEKNDIELYQDAINILLNERKK